MTPVFRSVEFTLESQKESGTMARKPGKTSYFILVSQNEIQSSNWEKAVKKSCVPSTELHATKGEKGTKFLLTNNLLIRVV